MVIQPGEEADVSFMFDSDPNPEVKWYFDWEIVNTSRPLDSTASHVFRPVGDKGGRITAVVQSCGSNVSTEMELVVVGECVLCSSGTFQLRTCM